MEKKYTDYDLQASFLTGAKFWLERNAVNLFLFFGAGLVTGYLLGFVSRACGCGA